MSRYDSGRGKAPMDTVRSKFGDRIAEFMLGYPQWAPRFWAQWDAPALEAPEELEKRCEAWLDRVQTDVDYAVDQAESIQRNSWMYRENLFGSGEAHRRGREEAVAFYMGRGFTREKAERLVGS
jgi:GNAT superfamily N-acetyltransferase